MSELRRTSIWLGCEDREALAALKRYYGLRGASDVIRLLVRESARRVMRVGPPPRRDEMPRSDDGLALC